MDPITQHWLELQCQYSSHVTAAVVMLGTPGAGDYRPMAWIPAQQPASELLTSNTHRLLQRGQQKPFARALTRGEGAVVACPIMASGQCFGMVAVMLDSGSRALQVQTAKALQWGCEWFTWLARERKAGREQDSRLLGFVEVMALALKFEDFQQTAQLVVNELRERITCDRVCLAMVKHTAMTVAALSGSRAGENVQAVANPMLRAMEEAADQKATIYVGPGSEDVGLVTHAHRQLMKDRKLESLCSVPMVYNGDVVAVLCFENFQAAEFDISDLHFCEQIALLLGPVMTLKQRLSQQRKRLFQGVSGRVKKLSALAVMIFLALCFIPGSYEVSATATVKSDKKQLLLAALDGYVSSASARAGDRVEAGQLLARLEDRDLKLEQQKWLGKKSQFMKSYNNALGSLDRAEINVYKAQLDQAEAQLALLANQLSRTEIVAPFDGVIVAGDLSQSLGAPVQRGELLYEIAPEQQFRLLLQVDERDIVELAEGQVGSVRLSSLPDEILTFTVSKVTPVSITLEGEHYFQVEALLNDADQSHLSPGMSGVAKIVMGERPYLWIWFHRSLEWLRMWYWRL